MSETKFEGFDWTELYEPLLGKPYPDDGMDAEKIYAADIREKMGSVMWDDDEKERTRVADLCRKFVLKCAEFDGHEAPLLKGLAAIEHDETFLRYMNPLLEYLWT